MKAFLVVSSLLLASCSAQWLVSPWSSLVHPWSTSQVLTSSLIAPRVVTTPQVIAAPAVALPTSSQWHAQDELGQFSFGHRGDNQARDEVKTIDGSVRGAYSYVDPTGKLVNVQYLADHNGFRVLGANNLPEAPVVPIALELKGPEPVKDTVEVIAARSAFEKKFAEVAEAAEKSPEELKVEEKKLEEVKSRRRRQVLWTTDSLLTSPLLTRTLLTSSPVITHTPIISAPIVPLAKTVIKTSELKPVEDAKTPAATKKAEIEEKEHEIVSPLGSLILPQTRTIVLSKDEKKEIFSPLPLTPYSTILL